LKTKAAQKLDQFYVFITECLPENYIGVENIIGSLQGRACLGRPVSYVFKTGSSKLLEL